MNMMTANIADRRLAAAVVEIWSRKKDDMGNMPALVFACQVLEIDPDDALDLMERVYGISTVRN